MSPRPWRRTRLLHSLLRELVNERAARWGAATLASMVLSAIAFSLAPVALAHWIGLVQSPNRAALASSLALYLALYLAGFFGRDIQWALFSRFEREVHRRLAVILLGSSLQSEDSSGSLGQLTTTLYGVQSFLFCVAFIIVPFSMEAFGMLLATSGAISWLVGAILVVFTVGFLVILHWSTERTSVHNRRLIQAGNSVVNFLTSAFERRNLIRRSRAEAFIEEKLGELVARREGERLRFGDTRTATTWVLDSWVVLCLLASLATTIALIRRGSLHLGEAVAVESFFFQLMRRLEVWARGYRDSAVSADQCEELLAWLSRCPVADAEAAAPPGPLPAPHAWTVLTGPTGSGKTTYLQRRYAAAPEGKTLVPQQAEILPMSLSANLTLGRFVPPVRLREVLEGLELTAVVARLPEGLDTVLSSTGAPLSGGETQRLCLARALLEEPNELLLDEPTSAQSEAQELAVLRFLRAFRPNMTVVAVTHRPAARAFAQAHWRAEGWNRIREGEARA